MSFCARHCEFLYSTNLYGTLFVVIFSQKSPHVRCSPRDDNALLFSRSDASHTQGGSISDPEKENVAAGLANLRANFFLFPPFLKLSRYYFFLFLGNDNGDPFANNSGRHFFTYRKGDRWNELG